VNGGGGETTTLTFLQAPRSAIQAGTSERSEGKEKVVRGHSRRITTTPRKPMPQRRIRRGREKRRCTTALKKNLCKKKQVQHSIHKEVVCWSEMQGVREGPIKQKGKNLLWGRLSKKKKKKSLEVHRRLEKKKKRKALGNATRERKEFLWEEKEEKESAILSASMGLHFCSFGKKKSGLAWGDRERHQNGRSQI